MPPIVVTFSVDSSSFRRALALGLRTTSRSAPKFLGSVAYQVAGRAGRLTPYVPLSRMDQELDAKATFRDGRPNKQNLTVGDAIVLARMNPNSRYNRMTDSRWAIPFGLSGLKAYGQLAKNVFYDRLAAYEERQKSGRHSSSHFLQSGWKAVRLALRAMGFRLQSGSGVAAGDDNPLNRRNVAPLGAVVAGGEGTQMPWIRIENTVGMEGTPNLAYSRNQALHDIGGPALQRALEEVAQYDLRDWNLAKDLEADLLAAWHSIPDANPQRPVARHNTLGSHIDNESMTADVQPFTR